MSSFTAHNVRMPDGSYTVSADTPALRSSTMAQSHLRTLRLVYGSRLTGRTLVDLGCLEGGYTLEFARAGMRALGVEVRAGNYANCLIVGNAHKQFDLRFVRDDVWNVARYGRFDVGFCSGLLYHLDEPCRFLKLLSGQVNDVLIINTHVAMPDTTTPPSGLSALTEHEGLAGRWYSEYDPASITPEALESAKWTSWSNARSFWPTMPALLQAVSHCGFDVVYEQLDWLTPTIQDGVTAEMYSQLGRRQIVAVRSTNVQASLMSGRTLAGNTVA